MTGGPSRSRFRRLAGVLLPLYAWLLVAAPVLHAALADAGRPRAAHVESSDKPCAPVHDELHCQACSAIRIASPLAAPAPLPDCVVVRAAPPLQALAGRTPAVVPAPLGSRAPPLA